MTKLEVLINDYPLVNRDNVSYEEAQEYFDYNVEGSYVGEKTPIWVNDEMFQDYGK